MQKHDRYNEKYENFVAHESRIHKSGEQQSRDEVFYMVLKETETITKKTLNSKRKSERKSFSFSY